MRGKVMRISKIIVKHARFFEIFSLMFSIINFVNVFIEVYLLFIRKNWFSGELRNIHFIMLQFFVVSFIISFAAKIGFSVIRNAASKGELKS
jgi:hypothetical protein